jgi:hypothetical protein
LIAAVVVAAGTGCVEDETLSVEQVIDNMLAATATERSRKAIQSLTTTADCMGPEGEFETTVTSIRPDTVYFRQASARAITELWSTPERTWGGNAGEDYELLTPRVRDFIRAQEFHLMIIDLESRFSDFELLGQRDVEGEDCLTVSMKDDAGEDASLCVGTDDWLPVELRLDRGSAAGPVHITFGDWREAEGLNLFHSMQVIEEPDRVFTYDFVDISVNTFAYEMRVPPPEMPKLRREQD